MAVMVRTFPARGMACSQCETNLETFLMELKGVEEAFPDVKIQVVTVRFETELVTEGQIREQIREAGFES